MRNGSASAVLALAVITLAGPSVRPASADDDDKKVTVAGCAVRGDDRDDTFLLANAVERTTTTVVDPAASVVTTDTSVNLQPSRVLYWLDDDDHEVDAFIGRQVEIVGEVKGDIDRGKVKVEREKGFIELEIHGGGHDATVRLPEVPSAVGTSGSVGDHETELHYLVRKLDVKDVRMIADTCR